jgi:hypothetical protein
MKLYVAHLKSGKCPKGSKEVNRKGFNRCKLRSKLFSHLSGRKKKY